MRQFKVIFKQLDANNPPDWSHTDLPAGFYIDGVTLFLYGGDNTWPYVVAMSVAMFNHVIQNAVDDAPVLLDVQRAPATLSVSDVVKIMLAARIDPEHINDEVITR